MIGTPVPRSSTSSRATPGSAYTVAVRVSGPTFAVTVTGPARSPSDTRTRTSPDRSVVATAGSTLPPVAVTVTCCPRNGAPVVSRTSSTSGTGSALPALPCSSTPCVNRVSPSDTTGRGGGGGGATDVVMKSMRVVGPSGGPFGIATVSRYAPGVLPASTWNVATPRQSVIATGSCAAPPGIAPG